MVSESSLIRRTASAFFFSSCSSRDICSTFFPMPLQDVCAVSYSLAEALLISCRLMVLSAAISTIFWISWYTKSTCSPTVPTDAAICSAAAAMECMVSLMPLTWAAESVTWVLIFPIFASMLPVPPLISRTVFPVFSKSLFKLFPITSSSSPDVIFNTFVRSPSSDATSRILSFTLIKLRRILTATSRAAAPAKRIAAPTARRILRIRLFKEVCMEEAS